jgi:NMD protein affecting ribosome stability and mRNA decay
MKPCPRCGEAKPLTEFYSNGAGTYCKPCTKADVARWVRKNPEQFRQTQRRSILKRKYGLTEQDVENMLAAQDSACLICAASLHDAGFTVDHDHITGRVRGLLCSRCNRLIGLLRDDPAVVRRAASCLRRTKIINMKPG